MGAIHNMMAQLRTAPIMPGAAPMSTPIRATGGGPFGNIAQALAPLAQQPKPMQGPQSPASPMQVPVQSQALQATPTSQPQTMQGPAFLQQFGDGMAGSAVNPRAQFDAAMYRRGGTPWQFGTNTLWAPQSTQQMAQNFAQGTMQPQAMPQLSDAQMQALAQMIAKQLRF